MSFLSKLWELVASIASPILWEHPEPKKFERTQIQPSGPEEPAPKKKRWRPRVQKKPPEWPEEVNISEAVVELPKQDVPKKPAEPAKPIVQDGPNEVGPLLEIGKIAETDKIEPAKPSKTIRKRRETPKIRVSEPGTAEIPGKVEKREKTRKNHVFHPGDRAYQLARLYDTDTDTVDIFPMKLATIVSRRKSEREGLPDSYIVILDGEKEQRRIVVDNLATQEEYPDWIPENAHLKVAASSFGRVKTYTKKHWHYDHDDEE